MVKFQPTEPLQIGPASYITRESKKAKNISLKLSLQSGLEVIVPQGFDHNQIPEILQSKQAWLRKATQRIESQRRLLGLDHADPLPSRIALQAIAETWQIEYHPTTTLTTLTEPLVGQLIVVGDPSQIDTCRSVLRRWLVCKAQEKLVPWLESVSQEIQLPFEKASVRGQKTRWASCSQHKSISLNYKLLFLAPPLVRYVLIHELCHTVHLNHSANFWALVGEKAPDYRSLDAELRNAHCFMPLWVE